MGKTKDYSLKTSNYLADMTGCESLLIAVFKLAAKDDSSIIRQLFKQRRPDGEAWLGGNAEMVRLLVGEAIMLEYEKWPNGTMKEARDARSKIVATLVERYDEDILKGQRK